MILIEEKQTKKLPGITSLFISFNYQKEVVEAVKLNFENYVYDNKTHVWEVSIKGLAKFIDSVCRLDDVELHLQEQTEEKSVIYPLQEYRTKPFDYQIEGIQYGLNHNNFLLLDAPGLGKTLTTIYLAQELKKRDGLKHCLIICGINTLKHNWEKEIQQHSDLSCRILGTREYKKKEGTYIGSVQDRLEDLKHPIKEFFIITNVETIRDTNIVKEILAGKHNEFDMIVVDEVHKCKSPTAQQGKNLLKLNKAKHRIGLTGTLLLNNPLDAYLPLKWIGADRSNYSNYKYFYCNFDGLFGNYVTGYKNTNVLKNQLEKYALRRTKDILNLPPKNIVHEFVDMNDQQKIFYDNIVDGEFSQVDRVHLSADSILSKVTRLLQATSCPQVLTTENITSSKVERAVDIAEQILSNGEKLVIFSKFKPTLNPIMEALKNYNPLLCTGDIKDDVISQNIDKFQNSEENRVMCCSVAKMGTGITLTRASYCIFVDCSWTAAENTQCEDRIYRIGSKSPVFIYYLWTNDSFDIHVKEIVENKDMISDYVVDNKINANLVERLRQIIIDL